MFLLLIAVEARVSKLAFNCVGRRVTDEPMWFLWKRSVTKAMSHSSQAIRIQADICTVCVCVCKWCLLCGLQRDASPSPLRRDFIFTWIRCTRGDEIFALYNKETEKIVCHSGEVTVVDPPYQVMQGNRKSGQHSMFHMQPQFGEKRTYQTITQTLFRFAMKLEVKGKNNVGWLIGTSVSFTCEELLCSHFK